MLRPASTAIERHYALLRLGYQTDADALASAHQFLWPEIEKEKQQQEAEQRSKQRQQQHGWGDKEDPEAGLSWEVRLARRYYAKLHREYALADMSRYKEGGIGLRWRTDREVFDGKGQFTCGNKACGESDGLESFEVHFAYQEHGERKHALVKLRCCPACADRLNYKQKKEERRRLRKEEKRRRRDRKRNRKCSRERDLDEDEEDSDAGSNADLDGTAVAPQEPKVGHTTARTKAAAVGAAAVGAAAVADRADRAAADAAPSMPHTHARVVVGGNHCGNEVEEDSEGALFERVCHELMR